MAERITRRVENTLHLSYGKEVGRREGGREGGREGEGGGSGKRESEMQVTHLRKSVLTLVATTSASILSSRNE